MLKTKIKNFLDKKYSLCILDTDTREKLAGEIVALISSNIQSGRKKWEKKHTKFWWSQRLRAVRKGRKIIT